MSDLLKCTICPKKPKFSDISHLLTHAGSKGHLHHLHGLQVRSHQDAEASRQLAIYNQWFQKHGLAALLSERMQQKQQKQADKKAANRQRMKAATANSKARGKNESKKLQAADENRSSKRAKTSSTFESASLSVAPDTSLYPALRSSPPHSYSGSAVHDEENVENIEEDTESNSRASSGSPKLKGTHWPGMALFDSASDELKRKRNQKKDISVLEKLERYAGLVEPTETVHSAIGAVLKHRHIDNLEDDSPVEGEEVVVQPSPKRRKTSVRRQSNKDSIKRSARPRRTQPETPVRLPLSSRVKKNDSSPLSSPVKKEEKDTKLPIRSIGRKRNKRRAFTVFEDSSPSLGVDGSSEVMSSTYFNSNAAHTQMLRQQTRQMSQQAEMFDPFKLIRDRIPSVYSSFADIAHGKENEQSFFAGNFHSHGPMVPNPLFLGANERYGMIDHYARDNRSDPILGLNSHTYSDVDILMPPRNPLLLAMEQLEKIKDQDGEVDPSGSMIHRQPLFAP